MEYDTEKVEKIFKSKGYIPLFESYKNNKQKLDFINKEGYKGCISLNKIKNIEKYLYFAVFNPFTIYNINHYCELNDLECRIYDNQEYKGTDFYLKAKCLVCGNDFYTTWHIISSKRYNKYRKCCKECSNYLTHKNDMKKYDINTVSKIFLNYDLTLLEKNYKDNKTKMLCMDNNGYTGKISLHQLLSGNKFNVFDKSNPFSLENVNIFLKNNNVKTSILSTIYKGNNNSYDFKCECGKVFKRSINSMVYNNALYCSDCSKLKKSKYHLSVREYLEKNKIKYVEEKRFKNCKDKNCLPFDFYLPDYNMCIEVQGEQHYIPKSIFGGMERLKITISHDIIKNFFCRSNNIGLIKIDYNNFHVNSYIYILNKALLK